MHGLSAERGRSALRTWPPAEALGGTRGVALPRWVCEQRQWGMGRVAETGQGAETMRWTDSAFGSQTTVRWLPRGGMFSINNLDMPFLLWETGKISFPEQIP